MKLCRFALSLACTVLLSACQSTTIVSTENYNPQTQARIRLYGQNQKPSLLEYVHNNEKVKQNVGGLLSDAFSSFVGGTKNISLGMPKTDWMNDMHDHDGILSKVFYREFYIPAGIPIHVHNAYIGLGGSYSDGKSVISHYEKSCRSRTVTFTAQPGRDYEVVPIVPINSSEFCAVEVRDITSGKSETL